MARYEAIEGPAKDKLFQFLDRLKEAICSAGLYLEEAEGEEGDFEQLVDEAGLPYVVKTRLKKVYDKLRQASDHHEDAYDLLELVFENCSYEPD